MTKKIDDIFKRAFENAEDSPPMHIWESIKDNLEDSRRKKRKFIAWSVAASVALLLAFSAGYFYSGFQNTNKVIVEGNVLPDVGNIQNEIQSAPSLTENEANTKKNAPVLVTGKTFEQNTKYNYALNTNKIVPDHENYNGDLSILDQKGNFGKQSEGLYDLFMKLGLVYLEKEEIEEIKALEDTVLQDNIEIDDQQKYDRKVRERVNKWMIAGQYAPMYASFYNTSGTLTNNHEKTDGTQASQSTEGTAQYNIGEPVFAYSTGVNVGYHLNDTWAVHSGVYYSKTGQEVNGALVLESSGPALGSGSYSVLNTPSGSINPNTVDAESFFNNAKSHQVVGNTTDGNLVYYNQTDLIQYFDYVELPLLFKYNIIDRVVGLHLIGGLSTGFLIDNSIYANDGESRSKIGNANNINSVIYHTTFGFGIDYNLNERLYLSLEPIFRYSVRPMLRNNEIRKYPYNLGLFTGIGFYL